MSTINCVLLKSERGLPKGKKTIFPAFCTLGTLWREENCTLPGHRQHEMLLGHEGELKWKSAERIWHKEGACAQKKADLPQALWKEKDFPKQGV